MNKKLLISALLVFAGASQVFASEDDGKNCGENVGNATTTSDDTTATSTPAAPKAPSCFATFKASCQNGYTWTANHAVGAKNATVKAGRKAADTTRKAVNFGKKQATVSNVATLWALDNKFDLVGKAQTAAHSVHSNLPARAQAVIALAAKKASVVTTPIADAYNKAANVVNNALEVAVKPFGINGATYKSHLSSVILANKSVILTNKIGKVCKKLAARKTQK